MNIEPFRTQVYLPKPNYEPSQTLQKSRTQNPRTWFDSTLLNQNSVKIKIQSLVTSYTTIRIHKPFQTFFTIILTNRNAEMQSKQIYHQKFSLHIDAQLCINQYSHGGNATQLTKKYIPSKIQILLLPFISPWNDL